MAALLAAAPPVTAGSSGASGSSSSSSSSASSASSAMLEILANAGGYDPDAQNSMVSAAGELLQAGRLDPKAGLSLITLFRWAATLGSFCVICRVLCGAADGNNVYANYAQLTGEL